MERLIHTNPDHLIWRSKAGPGAWVGSRDPRRGGMRAVLCVSILEHMRVDTLTSERFTSVIPYIRWRAPRGLRSSYYIPVSFHQSTDDEKAVGGRGRLSVRSTGPSAINYINL